MKRARARVRDLTDRRRVGLELCDVIEALNLFLRGWGNYFRTGNAADKFVQLDRHVAWRLKRLLIKKRGRNLRAGQAGRCTRTWGVPRPGTTPAHGHHPIPEGGVTMSRRSSVSRMRENRTYGLKGGWGTGLALRAPRP